MDYNDNNLLTDEQIDKYYNELKDFGAYNIPNQVSNSISIINSHLNDINEELNSMNSNRITNEKEEIKELQKELNESDEYITNYFDKATKKIEELKILLSEYEVLKPSVGAETKDDYKTSATNIDAERLNELRLTITNKIEDIKRIANGNRTINKPNINKVENEVIIDSLNDTKEKKNIKEEKEQDT